MGWRSSFLPNTPTKKTQEVVNKCIMTTTILALIIVLLGYDSLKLRAKLRHIEQQKKEDIRRRVIINL